LPEWIAEEGIGETRFALIDGEEIIEARIELDGVVVAGTVLQARLIALHPRPIARDDAGAEYLLSSAPAGVSEGGTFKIEVSRSAIPGTEPWKRPLARPAGQEPFRQSALDAKPGRLPPAWDDVIEEARSGMVRFEGGELRVSPTPAMTLIDVDGYRPAQELAVLGAAAAAKAIRRLDVGGSIGIDLPTAGSKAARQAAATAIDAQLPQPFERTAVNGFGFVQIVRPRPRASLLELAQDRAHFESRDFIRRVALEKPGAKRLVGHPALIAVLESKPGWIDALARQIGGRIELRSDPKLTMSGAYAEGV
jgi:ribonuclease G